MLKMAHETTKSSYNTTPLLNPISHNKLLNKAVLAIDGLENFKVFELNLIFICDFEASRNIS